MLTPFQISQANGATPGGGGTSPTQAMTPDQAKAWIQPTPVAKTAAEQEPSLAEHASFLGQRIAGDVQGAGDTLHNAITGQGEFEGKNPIERGVRGFEAAAGAVPKIASEFLPLPARENLAKAGDVAGGAINKAGEGYANIVDWLGQKLGISGATDFVKNYPEATKVIESGLRTTGALGSISTDILGAEGAKVVGETGLDAAKGIVKEGAGGPVVPNVEPGSVVPKTVIDTSDNDILSKYNKAIKPSVTGKANATQAAQANSKVITGVRAIADNKANLSFTDSEGNIIKGETPKTVQQTSEAIDQTKKSIFQKYDALAKQAGEKGVVVNGRQIAKELDPVIQSKALSISNPKAVQYAQNLQTRLWQGGKLDAETAQDVIKNYNEQLKSFYRNPTAEATSQMSIDAMIANKMRTALDDGITGATGEQYQELKNQYGALSSIEKDVARRAATLAKQSGSGFIGSISNVASGVELVKGLLTLNPVDMAISGTIQGIKALTKYLNDPDLNIARMFEGISGSGSKPIVPTPQTPKLKK